MNSPTTSFLVHGTDAPPAPPLQLRAGPLTLDLDNGDPRGIKLADREIVRRLYGAVRDQNWNTIPGSIRGFDCRNAEGGFQATYTSEHRQEDIHFVWRAAITGTRDGTIRFVFDGEAKSTFFRNRIGLCVLHPLRECAGAKCHAIYQDGATAQLSFPRRVAREQPVNGFTNLVGLKYELAPGIWAVLRFAGDLFETEDQRNWIDASFKTYCTPLGLANPVEVKAGTMIVQSVELSLHREQKARNRSDELIIRGGDEQSSERIASSLVTITIGNSSVDLPRIGLGGPSRDTSPGEHETPRLRQLGLSHLRIDVRIDNPDWPARFLIDTRSCMAPGLSIELAVYLSEHSDGTELARLSSELFRLGLDVSRVLVFDSSRTFTSVHALNLVRKHFRSRKCPIGSGTDSDLYELHLHPPPPDPDFICWSMTPQVHATDSRSIAESPEAVVHQVEAVASSYPGKPLVISPITLKPRFNPVATLPDATKPGSKLPSDVDARQMTLFGAAWTAAMLAALLPSGISSVTFFETTGWRGVMETTTGSSSPRKFPSYAGGVFPVFHVFAALADFSRVIVTTSSDPWKVPAFAIQNGARQRRVVLSNLTPQPVQVRCEFVVEVARILDETSVRAAMLNAGDWWRESAKASGSTITLSANAIAFLDLPS